MSDQTAASRENSHHGREQCSIEGEGTFATDGARREADQARPFRFSRVGPRGKQLDSSIRSKVARAMTSGPQRDGRIPAGFTYLGQFVDHDLTFDATTVALGEDITPADLLQGRSPTLDLDSVYGFGPDDEVSQKFYEADRTHLKVGTTSRIGNLRAREGFDVYGGNAGGNLGVRNFTGLKKLSIKIQCTDLADSPGLGSSLADIAFEDLGSTGRSVIDLGGGALGSIGGNCVGGGPLAASVIRYDVVARKLWWGRAAGPGLLSSVVVAGSLDSRHPLREAPAHCS